MRIYRYILSMVLMTVAVTTAFSESVELPSRMPNGKYVNDYATIFSNKEVQELEQICDEFREKTGNELIFLTVNSLNKMSIDSYAGSIQQHWKKQLDIYGYWVIVIIAPDESKYAIFRGPNVQAELSDGIISKIESNYLREELKSKNYFEGSVVTAQLLNGIITKELTKDDLKSGYQSTIITILIVFLVLFTILIPVTQFKTVREDTYGSKPISLVSALMIRYGKTFIGRHSFDDFSHSVGQFKTKSDQGSGGGASYGRW